MSETQASLVAAVSVTLFQVGCCRWSRCMMVNDLKMNGKLKPYPNLVRSLPTRLHCFLFHHIFFSFFLFFLLSFFSVLSPLLLPLSLSPLCSPCLDSPPRYLSMNVCLTIFPDQKCIRHNNNRYELGWCDRQINSSNKAKDSFQNREQLWRHKNWSFSFSTRQTPPQNP